MIEHNTNNRFGLDLGLGKSQDYPDSYDATLLQAIPRTLCRQNLPRQHFYGVDIWTGYELSWLDSLGKPQVAIAEFTIPASSQNIIESKSFKYYLNSFNQTCMGVDTLQDKLIEDLSRTVGQAVAVTLTALDDYRHPPSQLDQFECVDNYPLSNAIYTPSPDRLLKQESDNNVQQLCSHLLKSNCPVTGQPDWASVWVSIKGAMLKPEDFLAYIVSYRGHQDFHENCVEQMYCDLTQALNPKELWVYARYTRRGGLDINPFRASHDNLTVPYIKGARQ